MPLVLAGGLLAWPGAAPAAADAATGAADAAALRERLPPLDLAAVPDTPPAADQYLERYGLRVPGVGHHLGTFGSGPYTLVAHAFVPASPRGTVVVLHGYLDHTGTLAFTVRHLVERGWAVAAFDLPGHGLSSGARASIADFAEYDDALDAFLSRVFRDLPRPVHAVAHSTGAAILVTRLLARRDDRLGAVVLVAPLVHSAHWGLSTGAGRLLKPFVRDVPRVHRDNTSDRAFAEAVRSDPLQPRRTSLDWLGALVEWDGRISGYPPNPRPVVIVQGDEDSVVDWRYNLPFLREKLPNARVEMIEGGRHQLLGERMALRRRVLDAVDDALASWPAGGRP